MSPASSPEGFPNAISLGHPESFTTTAIAKGGIVSFFGLAIDRLATFLCEILLARFLGVTGYGTISLARSIFYIGYSIFNMGFPQTFIRFGTIYQHENDKPRLKGLISWITYGGLGIGILGAVILSLSANSLAGWFSDPDLVLPLQIIGWMLVSFGIATIFSSVCRAYLRHDLSVLIAAVFPLTSLVILPISNYIFKLGLFGASCALLLASILGAIVGFFCLHRLSSQTISSKSQIFQSREWLRFSLAMVSITISSEIMRQASRLIIGFYSSIEDVGLYTAASALVNNLTIFMLALLPVFSPLIAILYQKREEKPAWNRLVQTFHTATRWMLILTLPLLILVWVYGSEIMLLFGKGFSSATPILFILSISQLVNVGTGPVGMMLQMGGKQTLEFINGIIAVAVNIVLGVWLTSHNGVIGASIATTIAISALHIMRLLEVYLTMKIWPYNLAIIKTYIAASVSLGFTIIFNNLFSIGVPLLNIIMGSGIVFLTFGSIILVLGLDNEDKETIERILHGFKTRFKMN